MLTDSINRASERGAFNTEMFSVIEQVIQHSTNGSQKHYKKAIRAIKIKLMAAVLENKLNEPLKASLGLDMNALTRLLREPIFSYSNAIGVNEYSRLSVMDYFEHSNDTNDLDFTIFNFDALDIIESSLDKLEACRIADNLSSSMLKYYNANGWNMFTVEIKSNFEAYVHNYGDYRIVEWECTFLKDGKYVGENTPQRGQ